MHVESVSRDSNAKQTPRSRAVARAAVVIAVLFGVALLVAAVIAYSDIEQRLKVQELKVAELLSQRHNSVDELKEELQRTAEEQLETRKRALRTRRNGRRNATSHGTSHHSLHETIVKATAAGLHAAHLIPAYAAVHSHRYQLANANEQGLSRIDWAHISSGNHPSFVSSLSQMLSPLSQEWINIPESGLYYVYSQVTWWGQISTNTYPAVTTGGLFHSIAIVKNEDTYSHDKLATSMVRQLPGRNLDRPPLDTSHTSGIFYLKKGQKICVLADMTADINIEPDKTFFGLFLIRQDLDYDTLR